MQRVTPFAGVWIEICRQPRVWDFWQSLPSRECGLKLVAALGPLLMVIVTPFAGVWIEIQILQKSNRYRNSHSLRGSVDWNSEMDGRKCWEYVTPFAGVWIEILANGSQNKEKGVTPFAGVWIEILPSGYTTLAQNVTPFAGVWIEIGRWYDRRNWRTVTPFAGVWIEIANL